MIDSMTKAVQGSPVRQLAAFFALTFAITFGIGIAVIFFRPQFEGIFGELGPLLTSWPYYLGVSAPAISAVVLSVAFGGFEGIKNLFRGLTLPFQLRWLFIALLTFPTGLLIPGLAERIVGATPFINIHAIWISAQSRYLLPPILLSIPVRGVRRRAGAASRCHDSRRAFPH